MAVCSASEMLNLDLEDTNTKGGPSFVLVGRSSPRSPVEGLGDATGDDASATGEAGAEGGASTSGVPSPGGDTCPDDASEEGAETGHGVASGEAEPLAEGPSSEEVAASDTIGPDGTGWAGASGAGVAERSRGATSAVAALLTLRKASRRDRRADDPTLHASAAKELPPACGTSPKGPSSAGKLPGRALEPVRTTGVDGPHICGRQPAGTGRPPLGPASAGERSPLCIEAGSLRLSSSRRIGECACRFLAMGSPSARGDASSPRARFWPRVATMMT
jgi:hypothetical protein